MIPKDTLVYHFFEVLTALIFLVGVGGQVSFWLRGRGSGLGLSNAEGSAWERLGGFLRVSLAALGRGATWGRLWNRALLQRQIWRESRYRWVMHMAIMWGTAELFFVGSLGNMAVDLSALGGAELSKDAVLSLSKDAPWFAALNDLGGVLLLLGLVLALWRRWVVRPRQLRTLEEDVLILLWLGLVVLSGYFVEAARLLSAPLGPGPQSFLGYGLALPLGGLALPWAEVWAWAWWGHVLLAFGLIAYMPYSKLFHIIAAPYTAVVKEEGFGHSPVSMVPHG